MTDTRALVVLTTLPTSQSAAEIARVLVEEQLAACVNMVPAVRSIYRWQGAISDETETLAIIKTTTDRYDALAARLIVLHPYEVPEVIALTIHDGHAPYLAWLIGSTQ